MAISQCEPRLDLISYNTKTYISTLKIKRLKNNPKINLNADSEVVVVETGNQTEIKYSINNTGGYIRKISKDFYYDIRSGEVKEYNHSATSRKDNKSSIKRTMSNLRKLINTNITDYKKVIFVTLTYKENMTDPKQLYNDVRKFHQKLKIYLKKNNLPFDFGYISATECQARGAFHQHNLYFFNTTAPYIPNDKLQELWGRGYTKTKSLKKVDDIGMYLTAYLTDLDLSEDIEKLTGKKVDKAIIKGARLKLYPKGFRIYRCSKVKRPNVYKTTEAEAQQKVNNSVLTYEKTLRISNYEGKTINIINYRNYNRISKKKK